MKHIHTILLFAAAVLTTAGASAQMKTSYFMEGSIQRLDMNAALIPDRGYVLIPGIGDLGAGYTSNAFSVSNFLYPNPNGDGLVSFLHNSVGTDDFLNRLRNKNHLEQDTRVSLIGFGAYARRYFWSFGLNLRSSTSVTIPKEFFSVAKELQEGQYNLDGLQAMSDNYLEFALGFAFPIRIVEKSVTIGFRTKFLVGAGQAALRADRMQVTITDEEWRAELQGQLSGNVSGMDFSNLSGRMPFKDIQDRIKFDNFNAQRIGSWGLAFDVGAETKFFDDRLKVSLGLNDVGFMAWSQKSAVNGTFDDLNISFKGYDFDEGGAILDKPEDFIVDVTAPRNLTRMLTATLNVGGEYTFLENRIGVGLLSQTRFYGDYTYTELTVSGNFRPTYWFTASLSQSLIHNKIGAFGLALNIHPSWINFFIGMDYIGIHYARYKEVKVIPKNLNSVNVYMGLAIPLGGPREGGSFTRTYNHWDRY